MGKQAPKKSVEGAQFVRYFGPLLDALRGLGDPELRKRSSNVLPRISRFRMRLRMNFSHPANLDTAIRSTGPGSTSCGKVCSIHQGEVFGVSQSAVAPPC